jgi:hypothetical protein
MKKLFAAALAFALLQTGLVRPVSAEDAVPAAPVEAFYCNFLPGKGMKDLMPVAEREKQWADKHSPGYSAWILTPMFFYDLGRSMPQVVWLGSTPSGREFGKMEEDFAASGQEIQKAFDAIVDCSMGRFLASSVEINAPEGIPGDGVVMFSQCSIAEGSNRMKAMDAHRKMSRDMRAMGSKGSQWAFFPMLGGRGVDFDYWGVTTFASAQDYFNAYEIYVNGGGWQKAAEIMNGAASCDRTPPTVWKVDLVRKGPARK